MTIQYKDSKRIILNEADRTLRQGYGGGNGASNNNGGGGGGSSAVGVINGGAGTSNDISGSSLFYAGGGGGGNGQGSSTFGVGGSSIGGNGGQNAVGANATANRGSGGGGGGNDATNVYNGGSGSDGVIILRFTTSGNTYSQAGGVVTTSGSDTIITWTATSGTRTFTPTSAFNVRYLVVAGGGGGGADQAGAGGAGGYLAGTSHAVTAQAYTIVVGAGGAGGTSNNGTSGANSSFDTFTSIGGGYGASGSRDAGDGGSGGGMSDNSLSTAGAGTSSDITPTDVQDNSIMIEKDTGKRYWFDAELAPTFEDDFTSYATQGAADAVWVEDGTGKVAVNITDNDIDFNLKTETTAHGINYDFGVGNVSDTEWIIRYKMNLTTVNTTTMYTYWGLSSVSGSGTSTTRDFIGFNTTGTTFLGHDRDGADDTGGGDNSQSYTLVTGTDYYVTIKRTSATAYAYTLQTGSFSGTTVVNGTGTCASTIVGLRYFNCRNLNNQTTAGNLIGTIDDFEFYNGVTSVTPATWTYPPEGIDSSGQIAQLSGSNAANSYTAASEFYTISTDTWASAFNVSGGARARAGSAGSTEHAYLMGGQDGGGYFGTIDKVAWADKTNTTISRSTRAWGGAVQNAVSVCVGQSYYDGGYQTGINEYTYGTMAETSQGNTSSSHAFGGSFGNSTYGFVINGQNTGIERYTYSDKSKTASGFTASPTTTNSGGHTGNSTTGISINNTAGSGNARYDSYNISADTWTTNSATSSTPYEAGRASGSSTWNLWSTQTNTSSARQCEKYNYSSGALSSFTSVATNLDGGDQDAGASSINTGVNS